MARSKCSVYSCILATLFIHVVSPQAPPDQCDSLLNLTPQSSLQCMALEDCNGLQCSLDNYVASFVVTKCQDPVTVDLNITQAPVDIDEPRSLLSRQFTRSEAAVLSDNSDTVSVTMTRNASHLNFQAMTTASRTQVIPPVATFLNASDCMCSSLSVLAGRAVHSVIEPDCNTNDDCNGVRCELDLGILLYYVEAIVLPCENASEIVVEDRNRQPLHATIFTTETGTQSFTVDGLPLTARVILDIYDYSMFIQAFLEVPILGEEEIIPRHRIILDRTSCSVPLPTVTPSIGPPLTIPLPKNPSDTCLAFANIVASAQTEPFVCMLMTSCDKGISCRLNLPGRQSYVINITLDESQQVELSVVDRQGIVIVSTVGMDVNVSLSGSDRETNLVFTQNVDAANKILAVQLDLIRDNQPQSLISQTTVPLPTDSSSLSQGQVIAIAATIPFIAVLLISVVVVIGIWGCVMIVKHRQQKKAFEFKPMSYSDLQTGELEPYLKTAAAGSGSGAEGHTERSNGVSPEQEEEKKDLTTVEL